MRKVASMFDLRIHEWRQRHAKGEATVVRYADDFAIGFREESDARGCLAASKERMCCDKKVSGSFL